MSKYISIDIYGTCGNKTSCGRDKRHGKCAENMTDQYKFYSAAENVICKDYFTGKFELFHVIFSHSFCLSFSDCSSLAMNHPCLEMMKALFIGDTLLQRALHFAHREVLLHTFGQPHYVGEFVTSSSRCAEKSVTIHCYI